MRLTSSLSPTCRFQQRVAIARALANDPRVILADEPTGNVDSRTGAVIIQLLKQLSGQGRTVVVATHDQSIAEVADVRLQMEDERTRVDASTPNLPGIYPMDIVSESATP